MSYVPGRLPETQLRFIVLFALDRLGPCYDSQILKFVTDRNLMNYFDLMISLTDLCREGHACRQMRMDRALFSITRAGKDALALFPERVPESVRLQVEENVDETRREFRRAQEYNAVCRRTESGTYEAELYVMDRSVPAMKLTLPMPDEKTAQAVQEKWQNVGEEIYAYLIARLAEEIR